MTNRELAAHLYDLRLAPAEAAQLLGVAVRTLRRWLESEGEEVPGPAEAALRAWKKLAARSLPWRPDSVSIAEDNQDQIALYRAHALDLNAMLERVEARGGPRLPWTVNRIDCTATLGPLEMSYYKLPNSGFTLANYRRKDGDPDLERDRELIEDAAFCIARELRKVPEFGPVTLVYHDQPWQKGTVRQTLEECRSNKAAMRRVVELMGSAKFHDPFIMVGNEVLWDVRELRDGVERRKKAAAALAAVANDVRSAPFSRSGPRMLTPAETEQRQRRIESLAGKIDALAEIANEDPNAVGYHDFEPVLRDLHQAGSFPEPALVSAVAQALV
jgi:hypothetical protein